jgi:very-short-patch-repair endonuclease
VNQHLLLLVAVVVGLLVLVSVLSALLGHRPSNYPYEPYDSLLSPAERSFFGVLQQALQGEFTPLAKVRLADVLRVHRSGSAQRRAAAFNRVSSKHADFVICASDTFRVVGVVELDDKSHRGEARQQRDQFLDAALTAAGIPVLHIPAQRSYSIQDVRSRLGSLLTRDAVGASNRTPNQSLQPTAGGDDEQI